MVRTLQKFIAQAAWDDQAVLNELRRHVVDVFGDEDAVLILDETGFPKKGVNSVGVARQYSGTLGRIDNRQIGVFMSYCSPRGHTLFDRRLFLPESWTQDHARCAATGIPASVIFRTKPDLAGEMIEQASREGIPFRWVAGDSVYGSNPTLLQSLRLLGKWYVMDLTSSARAWTSPPVMRPIGRTTERGGRPTRNQKPSSKPRPIDELASDIPLTAKKRLQVAEGSQGLRLYEYAELTVWFSEGALPAEHPERLLVRRSLGQRTDLKYQRSNASSNVPLKKLAEVAGSRWCVEQDFQTGKGECGLDEYETRGWTGWHHHTALSLMALWFLTLQKARLGGKTSPDHSPRSPLRSTALVGTAAVGRIRDPELEPMAPGTKSRRQALPRETKTRRTAKAQ